MLVIGSFRSSRTSSSWYAPWSSRSSKRRPNANAITRETTKTPTITSTWTRGGERRRPCPSCAREPPVAPQRRTAEGGTDPQPRFPVPGRTGRRGLRFHRSAAPANRPTTPGGFERRASRRHRAHHRGDRDAAVVEGVAKYREHDERERDGPQRGDRFDDGRSRRGERDQSATIAATTTTTTRIEIDWSGSPRSPCPCAGARWRSLTSPDFRPARRTGRRGSAGRGVSADR